MRSHPNARIALLWGGRRGGEDREGSGRALDRDKRSGEVRGERAPKDAKDVVSARVAREAGQKLQQILAACTPNYPLSSPVASSPLGAPLTIAVSD